MIWRLAHPVRGIVAALVVWFVAPLLLGFGVGILELALVALCSVAVLTVVGRARGAAPVTDGRPAPPRSCP